MKTSERRVGFLASTTAGAILISLGCDIAGPEPDAELTARTDALVSSLLDAGYESDDIRIASLGEAIVQGDMVFSDRHPSSSGDASATPRQYRTDLLPDTDIEVVRIYAQSPLREDEDFMEILGDAVASWNDAGPLRIRFAIARDFPMFLGPPITDLERPIVIKPVSEGGCCPFFARRTFEGTASAALPFPELGRVNPGNEILVDVDCMISERYAVQQHILMHEIGHAMGLRHTDWQTRASCTDETPETAGPQGAQHIDGTPSDDDPDSVMNACYHSRVTGMWSEGDRIAIIKLFGR